MADKTCPKCKGTGIVAEKDGSVHTCFDCLRRGELDQHSKDMKETKIKP
jgi:DnaJ-class molecular chaperone